MFLIAHAWVGVWGLAWGNGTGVGVAGFSRFDDERLREDALKAFVKALHTDRMVAITGAMSTRSLGYPSWDEFIDAYAIAARDVAGEILKSRQGQAQLSSQPSGKLLRAIVEDADRLLSRDTSGNIEPRVSMEGSPFSGAYEQRDTGSEPADLEQLYVHPGDRKKAWESLERRSSREAAACLRAADALTIASRYGHSLQKTSLRIEIGQILMARGDPISGKALLEQAVRIATSKGYQHALERVRRGRNAVAVTAFLPNRTDIPVVSTG